MKRFQMLVPAILAMCFLVGCEATKELERSGFASEEIKSDIREIYTLLQDQSDFNRDMSEQNRKLAQLMSELITKISDAPTVTRQDIAELNSVVAAAKTKLTSLPPSSETASAEVKAADMKSTGLETLDPSSQLKAPTIDSLDDAATLILQLQKIVVDHEARLIKLEGMRASSTYPGVSSSSNVGGGVKSGGSSGTNMAVRAVAYEAYSNQPVYTEQVVYQAPPVQYQTVSPPLMYYDQSVYSTDVVDVPVYSPPNYVSRSSTRTTTSGFRSNCEGGVCRTGIFGRRR